MPHYSYESAFMAEYNRLTSAQQQMFMAAVQQYIIGPLSNGQRPPAHLVKNMSGYNLYEFRWDSSGRLRATCEMFVYPVGEMEVRWRRIGDHSIYQNP